MSRSISVVFNGYKRPHILKEQINAIDCQTYPVADKFYWQNTIQEVKYDYSTSNKIKSAYSNYNFGVWSRFAYALNTKTDYVCIFDDDTIPGSKWIENCINTYEKHPGLLGTIGIIFRDSNYTDYIRVGWDAPNEVTIQVDIVGHAWFFHRDLLSVFWRELPSIDQYMCVGEDIHFSHMIQKYTEYGTYVPPHLPDDRETWGSLKGWEYGADANATAYHAMGEMGKFLNNAVKDGFRLSYV